MENKSNFIALIFSIAFLLIGYFNFNGFTSDPKEDLQEFQAKFLDKISITNNKIQKIQESNLEIDESLGRNLQSDFYQKGISYFIFKEDELSYWSEDQSIILKDQLFKNASLYEVGNALQFKIIQSLDKSKVVALIKLENNFSYQNKYLQNGIYPDFKNPSFDQISREAIEGFEIIDNKGSPVFYLSQIATAEHENWTIVNGLLFLLGIILFVIYLPKILTKDSRIRPLFRILLLILIRFILFLQIPEYWENLLFFQAKIFAISYFTPSLGDFFLTSTLFLLIILNVKGIFDHFKSKIAALSISALALLFANFFILICSESISQSQINLQLSRLFEIDASSIVFYFSLIFLMISILLLIDLGVGLNKSSFQEKHRRWILMIILAFYVLLYGITDMDIVHLWAPLGFLLIFNYTENPKFPIRYSISLLFLLATVLTYWINHETSEKEVVKQKIILKKLSEERDPIAEYLYQELRTKIKEDIAFQSMAKDYWSNKKVVDNYLVNKYFQGYWKRYQIQLSLCDPNDSIYVNAWETTTKCANFFRERIERETKSKIDSGLYHLKNLVGRIDYIGEVPLKNQLLFVELSSNLLNHNEGYPELLLDKEGGHSILDESEYSYAVYDQDELVYKIGDYNYSTNQRISELSPGNFHQFESVDYLHTSYQKDKDVNITLSHKVLHLIDHLANLAYLLILIAIAFVIISLISNHSLVNFNLSLNDFSTKVQLFLIGSLLIALVSLAFSTSYYIKKQYQEKNSRLLAEKLRSVSIEVESKIGGEELLSADLQSYTASKLLKFSNVFYSDINLYDAEGKLYASSRPEIFEKNLKSDRMNPLALHALSKDAKAEWSQEENIGKMEFLSAYLPFRNYNNQILGYLNLPYFAKQGELEREISSFLVSTLNIYVGIFVLALLISVVLINQISKPLRMIKQHIGKLKLGSSIQLIEWHSQDEIGALVKEYNRISIELNESAEQLAKSEREIAWREMAKQVAHEIKNPLTPMKLSIQHLQRTKFENQENYQAQIDKTAQTLIEQIDALSGIASAFSSFAKLPEGELEHIDLIPILRTTSELYSSDIDIEFQHATIEEAIIHGNKDYLIRLFNNLIKNAIQATEEKEEPKIKVSIEELDNQYSISIEDNGIGIKEELRHRIFEPNFTTKSQGTGLGLAMSKSIIERMHGSIHFQSKENKGTVFQVKLQKAN